ncbi:CRISPR-associated helicase Cas3' [Porphyromonas bobii]|mgnify:FL=1|jgi:CRISPR-associated helicase cas3|uniref:CRISPR-associated helicase Cas3' n=1 Tax=Porphyromonas bobii TaxID=2811780 RepID=UPI001BFFFB7F|nr:CRISPR-associated helicase Cas3' [Porphyromonas bobii]
MLHDTTIIAHRTEGGEEQSLYDHVEGVALQIRRNLTEAGLKQLIPLGELLGRLHDAGKAQSAFQSYIRGESATKAPHSAAGALLSTKLLSTLPKGSLLKRTRIAQLLAYAISGHHRGLYNYAGLQNKLEDIDTKDRSKKAEENLSELMSEIQTWIRKHGPRTEAYLRKLASRVEGEEQAQALIRLLFSCLVDADFLDTEAFMDEERKECRHEATSRYTSIEILRDRLTKHMESFSIEGEINEARRAFLNQCREHGCTCSKGYYSLFLPTGGGKTLSSMTWALETALKHEAKRIIYVIPYTSIITQTAGIFREIFGEENVLEHHSDISFSGDKASQEVERYERTRLLAENWEAPIIVTTNVQFFESLFSHKVSRSRKVHSIANSVVVFDEVQMFPTEFLHPMLRLLEDLRCIFRTQLLFCSATLPPFDKDHSSSFKKVNDFHQLSEDIQPIIPEDPELFKVFDRVIYHLEEKVYTTKEQAQELSQHDSALCIVNSRRDASRLYHALLEEGKKAQNVIHLSRNMCSAHLKERIAEVRQRLKAKIPTIVISTQLIEAGVDIDLPIVYRAMSGLDSIVQAGGRCNREGKRPTPGEVYVFSLSDGGKAFGAIAHGQNATRFLLDNDKEHTRPSIPLELIEAYYDRYYASIESFDSKNIAESLYDEEEAKRWRFDFQQASEDFQLIENVDRDLFVPYGRGKELLEGLEKHTLYLNHRTLRELQQYHVSISKWRYEELEEARLLSEVVIDRETGKSILVLAPQGYDEALGVCTTNPLLDEPLFG